PYLTTVPLNRDGGITHWILTTNDNNGNDNDADAGSGRSRRPLLSSCESYKKIVLVADPGSGQVREEIGHGIGSVFTSTEYRGRSYASRMLGEVGTKLANWDLSPSYKPAPGSGSGSSGSKKAICSALWSDIGKKFYAKKGWIPFASQHVEFAACKGEQHGAAAKLPSTPITYANLAKFCAIDEAAVRSKLVKTAAATGKTAMAFAPSHDQMLWHLYRDSYIASIVLPDRDPSLAADVDGQPGNATAATNGTTAKGRESPASSSSSSSPSRQPRSGAALRRHPGAPEANEVKGIAVGPEGRRVWAIWTRNYATPAGPDAPQKNTLYILRLVVENEDEIGKDGDGEAAATTTEAFRAVIRAAQAFAAEWGCAHVDLWNPTGVVARLLRDSGLEHEVVEREEASIPSLMWYGEGTRTEDVVWVNNEKYCWC
ncbi:uncharacterized protein B0I36DRAFT_318527, partial [Microdochium trichocladiopsis]